MKFFHWLRSVIHRTKLESDMDSELRFHIESYTQDLIANGIPPAEALRRARFEFGNLELKKEDCRASLGLRLWDELRADLTYAGRLLRKSPAFTSVAVVSLALGIGANTAIFTLANELLYRPLAVPDAARLRMLNWTHRGKFHPRHVWGSFNRGPNGETLTNAFPLPLYKDLRQRQTFLDDLVAFKDMSQISVNAGGEAESLDAQLVSGNYYSALEVAPIAGRRILESDDVQGAAPVAVISDAYWFHRFGRSADAIGKTIRVNSLPVTIVGVNSPAFTGAKAVVHPEIFLPLNLIDRLDPRPDTSLVTDPNFWWTMLLGRLKPDVSDKVAHAAGTTEFQASLFAALADKPHEPYPGLVLTNGNRGFDIYTPESARPIYLLLGSASLVLLIACTNIAGLLLARASARTHEIGIRQALGAGRLRIFRQTITENMLLGLLGGLSGSYLGFSCYRLFENQWPQLPAIQFDWRVLGFATTVTVVTGLLFAIGPALRITATARPPSGNKSRSLFARALVVFQVALSLVLLVGASLFARTLANLKGVDVGFNPEHLLLFDLDPPRNLYKGPQRLSFFEQVRDRISALPGVQSVSASTQPLVGGSMENDCVHTTMVPQHKEEKDTPYLNRVGPGFFETLQIPIIMGRSFSQRDNQAGGRAAIINRKLAAQFFPGTNAIGQTLNFCDGDKPPVQIIGISADAKYSNVDTDSPPTLYSPYLQQGADWDLTFEVRTAASTESIVRQIRHEIAALDPDLPIIDIRTQTGQIDSMLGMQITFATLTSAFGLLALLLAAIGIYGIVAYNVSQRTSEIGIRMALGAQPQKVIRYILREAWLLALFGIALGSVTAFAATRLLEHSLFGVKPTDPLSFSIAGGLLLLCALVAGAIPAIRASKIEPCKALRHE